MAHLYHVKLSDGETYNVTADHYHDDHDDTTFRRYLLDIIKASIGGVISGTVVHFMHKGHK